MKNEMWAEAEESIVYLLHSNNMKHGLREDLIYQIYNHLDVMHMLLSPLKKLRSRSKHTKIVGYFNKIPGVPKKYSK